MNSDLIWQLGLFVLILIALNALFALHISIIGSVVLTVVLSLAMNAIRRR